jgi:hypothetical protein
MFLKPDMLLLAPMFFASGCNEPYILSTFGRHFTKAALGMEMVFFYGGCIVGALACGRLLDSVSHNAVRAKCGLLVLAMFTSVHFTAFAFAAHVEYGWNGLPVGLGPGSTLPSTCLCLWGTSDAMINTFLYWLVGALYPEDGPAKARACGVFKLLNSAAHIVGYMMAATPATTQLWVNVALYTLGAALSAVVVGRLHTPRRIQVGVEDEHRPSATC